MSDTSEVVRTFIKHLNRRFPWHIKARVVNSRLGFDHVSSCGAFKGTEFTPPYGQTKNFDETTDEPAEDFICRNCLKAEATRAKARPLS